MGDQKNFILAIAISVMIVVGWQVFITGPQMEADRARQAELEASRLAEGVPGLAGTDPVDAASLAAELAAGAPNRDAALASGARITIDTAYNLDGRRRGLTGSLALDGGRIDDLVIAGYRESVAPDSPEIVLLSPPGSADPYFADFGWTAEGGIATPGPTTVWQSDETVLGIDKPVRLYWDNGAGIVFEREIALDDNYMFTVTQRVTNTGEASFSLQPYGRASRIGTPDTSALFVVQEGPYGVFDGTLDDYSYDDLQDEPDGIEESTTGGWIGFTDKYWLVALIPDQEAAATARFDHQIQEGRDRYFATYLGAPHLVAPGATAEYTAHLFAGAKEVALIDAYEVDLGIDNFELTIDFGWFYFLTKPFFHAIAWLHGVVGNFGIAILLFTIGIKLVFFPLANKSYKAMSRMKALQPQMQALRERHGEDRQAMNRELMALYKSEKVNPAAGCLPIIIQIPVFFALYKVLLVTIEMRHAPFFGWIQDLSAPDPTTLFNLFGLIPWQPPIFLMIGIWPLIMGLTMFLQQKLNPPPADPIQARIFMALPVVFTVLLANFAAGLVIYWAWNNSLSILQQWVIMKRMGVKIGGGVEAKPLPPVAAGPKAAPADDEPAATAAPASGDASGDDPAEPSPPARKPMVVRRKKKSRRAGQRRRS